mmetsp:Transcript_18943/g.33364  ORF Transcript_18943/g.33364 Transcript_18943/m.33364 type:complete len:318 (-) Transcript_18943:202-1155(-)
MIQQVLALTRSRSLLIVVRVVVAFLTEERKSRGSTQTLNGLRVGLTSKYKLDERFDVSHGGIQMLRIVPPTLSFGLVPGLVKDIELWVCRRCRGSRGTVARLRGIALDDFKNMLRIEQSRIDLVGFVKSLTDVKYFCRLLTRRLWFEGLDVTKELLQDPMVRRRITTSVEFGNKASVFLQMLRRTSQGVYGEFRLFVGILVVTGTDVGCTVVQYNVDAASLMFGRRRRRSTDDGPLNIGLAFVRGDIPNQGDDVLVVKRSNGKNIDGDHFALVGTRSRCDLRPSTGCGTQIQDDLCGRIQNGELPIDLGQLEGGTTS